VSFVSELPGRSFIPSWEPFWDKRSGKATVQVVFQDLKRHNLTLRDKLQGCLNRVLESGWYLCGEELTAFEQAFARFLGVSHCVGVGNGTDALELALRCLDVRAGDRVATVANAGMYATTAILNVGAQPVYVDVDRTALTMCPESLERSLMPGTKAVIVTHLYGRAAALDEILEVARRAGLYVIEDCAQAHGARLRGKCVGAWGTVGCFSFYPTKNLGALGDGGAIVTSEAELADKLRCLRQYGWRTKYHAEIRGGRNSRLDELQAAVLRTKLTHLECWNARRRAIARSYSQALSGLSLIVPDVPEESYVAHLYILRCLRRDALREALARCGVMTDVHFPVPDYRQRSVCQVLDRSWQLPVTEESCDTVVSLPCYPELSDQEIKHVIGAVRAALQGS
jgi:dTDP-4-amino-4,6-dideoxygalactose transaminase